MEVAVVQIGNSRGVRLPKAILEQLNISDKLDMEVKNKQIVLKPLTDETPRKDWTQAFKRMHKNGDDAIGNMQGSEDFEWEW